MTKHKGKTGLIDVKELLQRDEDFLRAGPSGSTRCGRGDDVRSVSSVLCEVHDLAEASNYGLTALEYSGGRKPCCAML
jgi:hypothetical protein